MDFSNKDKISLFKYITDEDIKKFRNKPIIRTYKGVRGYFPMVTKLILCISL